MKQSKGPVKANGRSVCWDCRRTLTGMISQALILNLSMNIRHTQVKGMLEYLGSHPCNLYHQLMSPEGSAMGQPTLPKTMLFSALVASSDSAMIGRLSDGSCELLYSV